MFFGKWCYYTCLLIRGGCLIMVFLGGILYSCCLEQGVLYCYFVVWCYCTCLLIRGGCHIMLFGVWCYCQLSLIR